MLPYNQNLKPLARTLRSNMTDAEQRLWSRLRRKQVLNVQFYRQKPLAGYIADFYCAAAKLVIELDGAQHLETAAQERDRQRTAALQKLGLRVIRFDNRQVLLELDDVMSVIFAEVAKAIPPGPPFAKGGVKLPDSAPDKQPGKLARTHRTQARTTPAQTNAEQNPALATSAGKQPAAVFATGVQPSRTQPLPANAESSPPLCKRGARAAHVPQIPLDKFAATRYVVSPWISRVRSSAV